MSGVRVRFIEAGFTKHLEAISMHRGRLKTIRFPATVAVIEHPNQGVILFDTGYSVQFFEQTKYFPNRFYSLITPVTITPEKSAAQQIRNFGIDVRDVRNVVLSHFHADHIGGVADFPNARYIFRKSAYDAVRSLSDWGALRAGFLRGLLPSDFESRARQLVEADFTSFSFCEDFSRGCDLFGDGHVVAIDLPGHATGQIGLFIQESNGSRLFLVADACWGKEAYQKLRAPSPIAKAIFSDWSTYRQTLIKLNGAWRSSPGLKIIPCHCNQTLTEINNAAS